MARMTASQTAEYARAWEAYKDLVNTPAWREMVEEPLEREMKFCREEMANILTGSRSGLPADELLDLRAYYRALEFVKLQVLYRKQLGEEAEGVLKRRAVALGLSPEDIGITGG